MIDKINRQWRLVARPVGLVKETDFAWWEETAPAPGEGQLLVRNLYLSLDPTYRGWMNEGGSYMPGVALGAVMRGITIGEVEQSHNPQFPEGMHVLGVLGWQDYAVSNGRGLSILPELPGIPLTAHFGLFGHIGLSAYFGLLEIGQAKAGETLTVSAAAGAVGSLVGQIGKIVGCRVVGIAGNDEKCQWITDELGFDAAINYKTEPVQRSLKRLCPDGIDVHFENVSYQMLEAAINLINLRARIVLCGLIAQYNDRTPTPGPSNLGNLLRQRARLEGFIVTDYQGRAGEAIPKLAQWHLEGRLRYRVDVVDGLENAPGAYNRLFDGSNRGKLIIKLT